MLGPVGGVESQGFCLFVGLFFGSLALLWVFRSLQGGGKKLVFLESEHLLCDPFALGLENTLQGNAVGNGAPNCEIPVMSPTAICH